MRTKKWYQKIAIVCAIIMTILNVGVFDAQAVETTVNEEDVCSCGGCLEDDLSYYTPDTLVVMIFEMCNIDSTIKPPTTA